MNRTRLVWTVFSCLSIVSGMSACDSDPPGTPTPDSGGTQNVPIGCAVGMDPTAADMAQPEEIFVINRFQLPSGASATVVDGLDVDAQTTSSTSDAAGCFVRDTKSTATSTVSNVDNQLAAVGTAAATLGVDISKALQDAVAPSTGAASLEIKVGLKNWNHTLTDNCVAVGLYVGAPGSSTLLATQVTALNGGISPVVSNWGTLNVSVTVSGIAGCTSMPGVSCGGGQTQDCSATIPLKLFGVKLRLNVQAKTGGGFQLVTNRPNPPENVTTVANPSIIGGFLYWGAKTGTPEAGSFQEALKNALCELGQGGQWSTVQSIIAGKLDLHSTAAGATPDACTGTSAASGNANAISIGAYAGSGY